MAISDSGRRAGEEGARAVAQHTRRLRNSLISLGVFFALVAALLLGIPGLRSAADRISDAKAPWVVLAGALELLSCLGYVVLFDAVFRRLGRGLSARLALSELAVNSVVSLSGLAGIALGAWVLSTRGYSLARVARRSVVLFLLTSAVNVVAVAVIGIVMWLGLVPGSRNEWLTLVPALAALATIAATLALASWAGRAAAARRMRETRTKLALDALSGGVAETLALLRSGDWRLAGAVAYWLCDNLALYACLAAFGHPATVWVVAMAYLVGMLANSLPIPGGFVAVEGGLVGMLLLFGARPGTLVIAAVVVYRAISLWIPAVIGTLAFLRLRREIAGPAESATASG